MLLDFNSWWQAMGVFEKIYWSIALPFTALFLIQLVLTFFGGDMDDVEAGGDVDAEIESDAGIDFQFITLKNLIAFFTIFGWAGIACIDAGYSTSKTILVSTIAGLIMMTIMALMMYFMAKMTDSGTLSLKNAIGKVGSVYLTIPKKREGFGKVQIKVQGLQTLDAMTDDIEEIKTGAIVEVLEIINNEILLVRKS